MLGALNQGIQLANERASGQFRYLSLADPAVSLAESFALLRETLQDDVSGEAHGPLVVLDDVSALAWMGPEVRDVLRWWNGVRSLLGPVRFFVPGFSSSIRSATNSRAAPRKQARATLLTLQHYAPSPSAGIEEDPSDTWLFRSLLQRSDLWLQVEPVGGGGGGGAASSGAATSGEVGPEERVPLTRFYHGGTDSSTLTCRSRYTSRRPTYPSPLRPSTR